MRYFRHTDRGSGFGVQTEAGDGLPLIEAGEVWAPRYWSIRPHANRGWEAYFQPRGRSRWRIGEEDPEVPENGGYLIRPGVEHRLLEFMDENTHFYYAVFPSEAIPPEVKDALCWKFNYTIYHTAAPLLLPFQGIIQELAIREAWQEEVCRGYLAALGAALSRLSCARREEHALGRDPRAERALRLLTSRIEYPWRLTELARLCGVSVPHLIEVFRQEFGETPMRRLKRLRLEEAWRQLRQTNKTVTDVAYDLGFSSSQHLSRSFREVFGVPPTDLRKS